MKKMLGLTTALIVGTALFSGCNWQPATMQAQPEQVNQAEQAEQSELVSVGSFVDYSPTAIAEASKDNGKAVLFFHAKWCPTCLAAEKEILAGQDQIPSNITIIKTDFDSMKDLKKKYSIVNQHTFVQVDADGTEVTRWVGGGLKTILQKVE